MSDFLLELGQNKQAKKLIKTLGLPIPIPEKLKRVRVGEPMGERPLADYDIVYGAYQGGTLGGIVAETLGAAGANPHVTGDAAAILPFRAPGEAFGRPARSFTPSDDMALRPDGIVFDATRIDEPSQLVALYEFFHPIIQSLARSGRVIVLGRPAEAFGTSPARAAAQVALEGFVRSVAKEVGRIGATAQLVTVEEGAESRLPAILRFLLSPRSAFISAQPIRVSTRVAQSAPPALVRSLEGKVALVTGAARGIGAAAVKILAAEGAHVVCLDRPEDDGPTSQLAREINGSTLLVDVMSPEAPARIASELLARFGGVDVVIHNAGVTRDKTLGRMKESAWNQAVEINLGAVVRITEALVAGDKPVLRDNGRLVFLSSVAGIAGNVGQTNYSASKSGVIGYVRALAPLLAPRGIAVNAIAPGFIETRLTAAIPIAIREGGRRLSALGQGGLPEDVGQLITFLGSPGAGGLSGQVIRICGGALIGA